MKKQIVNTLYKFNIGDKYKDQFQNHDFNIKKYEKKMASNEKEVNIISSKMQNYFNIYQDKKTNPNFENISY